MFESEQVTDDLIIKLIEELPSFCEGSRSVRVWRVVAAFGKHYGKPIKNEQSLRAIGDSLFRLLKADKIIYNKIRGYGVVKMFDNGFFDDEQVTDDLTIKFVKGHPIFCADHSIVRDFDMYYHRAFRDSGDLIKIYTSIARLLNAGKIVRTEETGYKVAKNG